MNFKKLLKQGIKPQNSPINPVKPGAVQFNLIPDVKRQSLQSQVLKAKIRTIAYGAAASAIGLLLILAIWVYAVQKSLLSSSAKQIASATANIKTEPELAKALTVQNQLYTLADLHANKHISSRVFGYLTQLTPAGVSITQLSIDYAANSIQLAGIADNATSVNQFIDTLKFAKYTVGDGPATTAFSSVVESSFTIGAQNVSYAITANFDPQLFSNGLKDASGSPTAPKLQVNSQITTRSTDSSVFSSGGQ